MTAVSLESQKKLACSWKKREKRVILRVEKTVLTGKVAGEQEHHEEDYQERDVRLQDSWDERVENVMQRDEKRDRIIDEEK